MSTEDLIKYGLEQKPIEFEKTFDALIRDKIANKISEKRDEIAKTVFQNKETEEVDV